MQQINLYVPELRPRTDYLSAGKCVSAALVLVLVLAAVSLKMVLAEGSLTAEVARLEQSSQELQAELEKLKRPPDQAVQKQLERQIEAARAGLANRQRLVEVLDGETLGNTRGFSEQVTALSNLLPAGLSLDYFGLANGGRYLNLKGQSYEANTVAAFLAKLRRHNVFFETKFGELNVQDRDGTFIFSLSETSVPTRTDADALLERFSNPL